MEPVFWIAAAAVVAALGALTVRRRSTASRADSTLGRRLRAFADRVVPMDADRALDRIADVSAASVAGAIRRGTIPGNATVRLGSAIYYTATGDGLDEIISTVRSTFATMTPPIAGAETMPVTVLENPNLKPEEARVAIGSRTRRNGPTPAPLTEAGPDPIEVCESAHSEPRVRVELDSITPGVPSFSVGPSPTKSIGRGDCDLALPEGSGPAFKTSRRHATIRVRPTGDVEIKDSASSWGTFVNGERIDTADLVDGDRLTLGDANWLVWIHLTV